MTRVAVIEAPSIPGPRPTGVETLPGALLAGGLIDRLRARDAGRVAPESRYDARRDSTTLTLMPAAVRSRGIDATARDTVGPLTRDGGADDGVWIHVDADVLDDAIMPAVDYRLPGGFSSEELTGALSLAIQSRRAVGLEVTIYNPQLDPGRRGARGLVRVIGDALG